MFQPQFQNNRNRQTEAGKAIDVISIKVTQREHHSLIKVLPDEGPT